MKRYPLALSFIMLALCLPYPGLSGQREPGGILAPASASEPISVPAPAGVLDGDIIFQSSALSTQSLAIRLATHSPYSHCGIVFFRDGEPYVFEAIRTVSWTPLDAWIKRGVDGHYMLLRLKDREQRLTPGVLAAMREVGGGFDGKGYDLLFQWSDETIYCSELVWKIYERGAGMPLAPLRRIRDYDLNHDEVQRKIKERFGYDIPWDEQVVAPSDLMESALLERVGGN